MDNYNFTFVIDMKKVINIACLLMSVTILFSCDNFLDIVPNDTPSIEKSFKIRRQAKKFLYTCYSYLPRFGSEGIGTPANPALLGSHEFILNSEHGSFPNRQYNIRQDGELNVANPITNYWEGRNMGSDLYEAIRKCNVFLEKIHNVGNMKQSEKEQWKAEVKFLKAYYYFYLTRMYGPIELYKKNIPLDAPQEKLEVPRTSIDSSFAYVEKLLNEVIHTPELPARITNRNKNLGRITKSIAYAMKAKVEVFAASPLYDGNEDYDGFQNVNGDNPFDTKKGTDGNPAAKWDSAAAACKKAIDFVRAHNFALYKFQSSSATAGSIKDSTRLKMTIRNSFASSRNVINSETIWPLIALNGNNYQRKQRFNMIPGTNPQNVTNIYPEGMNGPPLKIAEMFYSNHGVPITQDKSWDYDSRYEVKTVGKDERFFLKEGYKTAELNMHREPRYYADLDFDGVIHYGSGIYGGGLSNYSFVEALKGDKNSQHTISGLFYSQTGYHIKKLVNYRTELGNSGHEVTYNRYNWKIMRLADLYLLYAEAKNEADGPGPEVFKYINMVRKRAGLPTVQQAWSNWSTNPGQYNSKAGMRKIIHRERLIELAFEGHRFWDLRRWKEAKEKRSRPIQGWQISSSNSEGYYHPVTIHNPSFRSKDYLWPLSQQTLQKNRSLTQNPGY